MGGELFREKAHSGHRHIAWRDRHGSGATEPPQRPELPECASDELAGGYITFTPDLIDEDGHVSNPSTEAFLRKFMEEFHDFIVRVLTVLPHEDAPCPSD